ncbi:MAG: endonuclease III [Candidatus Verstraetearchaeota archaeon]|nr:endonuclease III [Candidatus Verstraetearchaeota archaeon]
MDGREMLRMMKNALAEGEKTALAEVGEKERSPFAVLISTVLSHRTRDEKTSEAAKRLFSRFREPKDLAAAEEGEVAELIRGVGFYRNKAKAIIAIAKEIVRRGGVVPNTISELMELPSVGRKTANCVLAYGFGIEAIPVDTHVHRIANRLGIAKTKTPEETEAELEKFFEKEDWGEVNNIFVLFGKRICRPISPKCKICPMTDECRYFQEKRRSD